MSHIASPSLLVLPSSSLIRTSKVTSLHYKRLRPTMIMHFSLSKNCVVTTTNGPPLVENLVYKKVPALPFLQACYQFPGSNLSLADYHLLESQLVPGFLECQLVLLTSGPAISSAKPNSILKRPTACSEGQAHSFFHQ